MGIDIDSKVMVGARAGDMPELDGYDDICGWADDNNLSYASPYYDCERCDYILGFELTECKIDSDNIIHDIASYKSRFKEITGYDGEVIITNDVW